MSDGFKQVAMALERLREEHERVKAELRAKVISTELRGYDGLVDEMGKLREENEQLKEQALIEFDYRKELVADIHRLEGRNAALVNQLENYKLFTLGVLNTKKGIAEIRSTAEKVLVSIEKAIKNNAGGE